MYRHVSFYYASLFCTSQIMHLLQIEGKISASKKDYNLLYSYTHFTEVVCKRAHNISKVCLYYSEEKVLTL